MLVLLDPAHLKTSIGVAYFCIILNMIDFYRIIRTPAWKNVNIHVCCQKKKNMFFSMYARGSLVILLLVTYILTDEPSNQKRVSSMYVQESLFILLLGTYIHTDQPKMSAPTLSTSVSMYVKTRSTYMYVVKIVSLEWVTYIHSDEPRP